LKKEHGLIDWSKPAEQIVNHVRAMQPWPTAYTYFHRPGKEPMRVIICRASAQGPHLPMNVDKGFIWPTGMPGQRALAVEAGPHEEAPYRSTVRVLELQPAGKKRMTAEEFLRGYPIHVDERFGPERLA
jgi:methionyl-tRNA formyltransferase